MLSLSNLYRAAEYQEKMGGLGMWDDEMEMVTNPLVLKISEEKKKVSHAV